MKIVHICLCGSFSEGWHYQDNLLSKYHVKLGHSVTLITNQFSWNDKGKIVVCTETNYVNNDGVLVHRIPLLPGIHNKRLRRYHGLLSLLNLEQPDILFVHGFQFLDVIKVVKYVKANPNITVYADNHSDFLNSAKNWLSKNILHGIIWRQCALEIEPYTKKFYGVIPARVDFLVDMYKLPKEKCELLVLGADDEYVENASQLETKKTTRKKFGINNNDFLLVTGGKIDYGKAQTLCLMEAVRQIKNPNLKLLVFGSIIPQLKNDFEKLLCPNKVLYGGWQSPKDSYNIFAAADLVVFPGGHSVFWEQVVALGIPMIIKEMDGTSHVDIGGNVKSIKDGSISEITTIINELFPVSSVYNTMRIAALHDNRKQFLYSTIAKRSIESVNQNVE